MSRFKFAAMLAVALSAAACSNGTTTSPTTTPPPASVTDAFSGTLTRNGASSFPFSVSSAGFVFATLSSVANPAAIVGLSLGTWKGSACAATLSNDQAVQGTTVTGSVSGIGTLCARVYDVGRIEDAVDFQLTVVHP